MVLWKSDREINFVAAKFYLAEQQYELAEKAIKYTISEGDLQSQLPRGYYEEQFQLYRDILIRSGRDPLKLKLIKEGLQRYQDAKSYEELLDMGIEGQYNYKIGLRVMQQNDPKVRGLQVLKAYSAYPFALASMVKGDIVLKLAHREVLNLKAIFRILSNFEPGTIRPLKISRAGELMELTLKVK
ncbi:hypothetical protein [uncultured Paraglaciecola sp.]|mgnify:FL=1|uniref:hypothetical protein n=1 Tax=uncultured Paraglaciecola sp. TaxID=1765024 RepID=UPI00263022F1|nr:hypothetical protein [uncultured Paraglaciecola sp.]